MRRSNQYFVRRIHRFLGVFIGIQFLFWTISGLYFSWTDINEIHGDHFHQDHLMQQTATELIDLSELDSSLMISTFEMRFVNQLPYYWVNGQQLFDAKSGLSKEKITENEAKKIAETYIKGDFEIRSVEYLTETSSHHEYRGKSLPAWAVNFEHPENLTAYIDAKSGNFERVRHTSWRWFDFLWMFHTMDYAGRDNFNNVLLRAFSLFGLFTISSRFALFFMTMKPKTKKKI